MDSRIFYDKYGNCYTLREQKVHKRVQTYIIIKKNDELVCLLNENVYSFPSLDDIEMKGVPTLEFTVNANIWDNGYFVEELQNFKIYDIGEANFDNMPLKWCKIKDILVEAICFDFTQKKGFKNFLVRVK